MARGGIATPDPYVIVDAGDFRDIAGLSVRSAAINPALKTLVLITIGQSQICNVMPSAFVPTNSSVIDNMNIWDGALYNITGRMLGCTNSGAAPGGFGNVGANVADLLVTNGKFDRVIIASIALGGTLAIQWGIGNMSNRVAVAMRRFAARNITPSTPGVTFAMLWCCGESDGVSGTSAADYTTYFNNMLSIANAAGFSGRTFVTVETWLSSTTYPTIQNAQIALVNGATVFSGGNWDSLNASNRQADLTHWNDAGGAAAALLTYNAMHASGAPY